MRRSRTSSRSSTQRYPQTWPTDLAAAYLASTYRLMQRTADADRIIAIGPVVGHEARPRRGDRTTTRSCTTRSCCICSRSISRNASAQTPPAALETISAAVSGRRADVVVSGVHAARAGCLCDGNGRHGEVEHHAKSARTVRACADAAGGAMPKVPIPQTAARLRVLERQDRSPPTTSSTNRASIGIRRPRS